MRAITLALSTAVLGPLMAVSHAPSQTVESTLSARPMAVSSGDDSGSSADSQRHAADTAAVQRQPASIPDIIRSAFTPLGPDTADWALRIASCESTNNPDAVNASSGAEGLFQFLPSTWALTPWANSSPFDPSANAQAAAWLYANSGGADNWECKA